MQSQRLFGALALAATLGASACSSASDASSSTSTPTTLTPTTLNPETSTSAASTSASSTPAESSTPPDTDAMSPGMDMGHGAPATGLALRVLATSASVGSPTDLSFIIDGADGRPITSYEVEQTKKLHLVVVRSDLSNYQHIHPTMAGDGTWSIPATFAVGGTYRLVADFTPVIDAMPAGRTSLTADLTVDGAGSDTALPDPASTTSVDGYTVAIAGRLTSGTTSGLTFTITDGAGRPVTLEPYLGAYGHLVAFAQADLAYTHIHPASADRAGGVVMFEGVVAAPGRHRLFMQFATAGTVHTAEFTIDAG